MRRNILLLLPLALAVLAGCRDQELPTESAPAAASHAVSVGTMIDLGTLPGGTWSIANGINNRGQIVGSGDSADGEERAFLWQNGTMVDLGTLPGGAFTSAHGINNRGQVVGSIWNEDFTTLRAFLWQNGTMIDLGTLGGMFSHATAINDRGEVVGFSSDADGFLRAFLWRNGTMTELDMLPGGHNSQALGINSRGQVAGYSGIEFAPSAVTERAVLWYKGAIIDLGVLPSTAFFTWSFATDINDGGQVAGWGRTTVNGVHRTHAFSWQDGVMTDLGTLPGGTRSLAWGINNRGQIVGESGPGFDSHAVLWQNGSIVDLGTLGGAFAAAYGINDPGQAVGVSETADGDWHAFVVDTRPGNVSQAASVSPLQANLNRAAVSQGGERRERPAALERLLRCGPRAPHLSLNGEVGLGGCRP